MGVSDLKNLGAVFLVCALLAPTTVNAAATAPVRASQVVPAKPVVATRTVAHDTGESELAAGGSLLLVLIGSLAAMLAVVSAAGGSKSNG